ncbi:Electroneutral sodium bicarbonate exchanger 1, partial [Cichlidogyrus casuarinus]
WCDLFNIAEVLVDQFIEENKLDAKHRDRTIELLLKKHTHLHDKMKHKMGRTGTSTALPLIRSLADIGKRYSSKDMDKVTFHAASIFYPSPKTTYVASSLTESAKPGQTSSSRPSFVFGGESDLTRSISGIPENSDSSNVTGNRDPIAIDTEEEVPRIERRHSSTELALDDAKICDSSDKQKRNGHNHLHLPHWLPHLHQDSKSVI